MFLASADLDQEFATGGRRLWRLQTVESCGKSRESAHVVPHYSNTKFDPETRDFVYCSSPEARLARFGALGAGDLMERFNYSTSPRPSDHVFPESTAKGCSGRNASPARTAATAPHQLYTPAHHTTPPTLLRTAPATLGITPPHRTTPTYTASICFC